jgi:hypothetical protein
MSVIWTSHLRCASCDKEFIVNRVSLAEVYSVQSLLPCPYCYAAPSLSRPHKLSYIYASNFPYRKSRGGEVWHCSEYCSGWPAEDFIEIEFPPEAELCNECRALVGA